MMSDTQIQSATNGYMGVMVVMWKPYALKLENLTVTTPGIHFTVKVLRNTYSRNLSTIYASPDFNTRTLL